MLKSRIIKLLITCEPFDFFGTTAKKFARTPCLFAAISVKTGEACALSSRGVSRRCYITTVTGNSWLQLDAIVDATFIDLLGEPSVICSNLYTNSVIFSNKIAIIRRFRN